MEVTKAASADHIDVTPALVFRSDLFDSAMRRRHDCRTLKERAKAAGVSRQTLWRLRGSVLAETPACAHRLAAAADLTVDELFTPAIPTQAVA